MTFGNQLIKVAPWGESAKLGNSAASCSLIPVISYCSSPIIREETVNANGAKLHWDQTRQCSVLIDINNNRVGDLNAGVSITDLYFFKGRLIYSSVQFRTKKWSANEIILISSIGFYHAASTFCVVLSSSHIYMNIASQKGFSKSKCRMRLIKGLSGSFSRTLGVHLQSAKTYPSV